MTMPTSPKKILMRVRNRLAVDQFRIDNFEQGGWKVRNDTNTAWIRMGPTNVRVRNPLHDENTHQPDDENFPLWLEPIDRSQD